MLANLRVELLGFIGTEAILCLKVYKLGVDGLFVDPSVGSVFLIPVVIFIIVPPSSGRSCQHSGSAALTGSFSCCFASLSALRPMNFYTPACNMYL